MKCPKCEKTIKRQTLQCPHCGFLIPRGKSAKAAAKILMEPKLCLAVGLLLAFIGLVLLISDANYYSMFPIGLGAALLFLGKKMKS